MALATWGGAPAQQGATPYVDTPNGRVEVPRIDSYAQQQANAEWARMAAAMAPQQQPYATIGVQGSGPAFGGASGGGGYNPNAALSQFIASANGSAAAPPTLQLPNAPTMPNFSASGSASTTSPYDSQIRALVAQLQGQAAQSDSALSDRANQQIAAQRAVLDRRANQDVQRSLAANGLLPTGGLAARMREQISRPYEDSLAASSESINNDLRSQRNATANNLISSLAGLQNSQANYALDQQRLQQAQQQQAWQQQVDVYNAQVRQNESAYSRALDAYNMNLQQQQLAQQQQARQQAAYQASTGGGGSMTGSVSGWNGGQNGFLDSGRQPEETYAMHQQIGRLTNGQVGDSYFSAGNQQLRAQQEQRAAQVQSNRGNGLTSSGSNFNPNDPFGQTLASNSSGGMYGGGSSGGYGTGGSYGSNAYNTAMGIGSIVGGAAQSLGGTLGSYANSGYGRSAY